MRALIIGAGDAGRNIAGKLTELGHDVVLIDEIDEPLVAAQAQYDILTIEGNGSSPSILNKAEIEKTDMIIAVTHRDETNILACLYAQAAGVSYKVARVSNTEFTSEESRMDLHKMGLDMVICHKEHSAREMYNVLRRPGSMEVVDLLDEHVLAVGVRTSEKSPLVSCALKDLRDEPRLQLMRFLAIIRDEEIIVPRGDTQIQAGDHVYVAIQPENADDFIEWACPDRGVFERVVISGGGDLGFRLAQLLETRPLDIVLIEKDQERAAFCSEHLDKTLVIGADTLDPDTLGNAGVIKGTAFVATKGDDEDNIISCLLAKKLGASVALAKVGKPEYVPVINGLNLIDRVISPQQALVNSILHYVRGRNVHGATVLHRLPGELLEIVLPADSDWAGKAVKDISIPKKALVAAVLRDEIVQIATGDLQLEAQDRLVVFALPEAVKKLQSKVTGWRGRT